MIKLNIHEAKTHLSKYLAKLKAGDRILLCKRNQPIAEITALPASPSRRRPVGLAKDSFTVPRSFFDALPADVLQAFDRQARMRYLLDTRTFLWIIAGAQDLSPNALQIFTNPAHEIMLSAVSVWEISVKHALGKLPLPTALDQFIMTHRERHGIIALALHERAVLHLHKLPSFHRDPFDRMLMCQAIEHDCVLLTPDPLISQYPIRTQW